MRTKTAIHCLQQTNRHTENRVKTLLAGEPDATEKKEGTHQTSSKLTIKRQTDGRVRDIHIKNVMRILLTSVLGVRDQHYTDRLTGRRTGKGDKQKHKQELDR